MKRALEGAQLQPSAPELDERHARLGEKSCLNLLHRGKKLQGMVTFVSSRDRAAELGWKSSEILGPQEGSCWRSGGYCSEQRHGWNNAYLRWNDLWSGCLRNRRHVASHEDSEQNTEPFVLHQISLFTDSCPSPRNRRNALHLPPETLVVAGESGAGLLRCERNQIAANKTILRGLAFACLCE